MADSDFMPRKRSLFSFVTTILIIHFVFAFATYFLMSVFAVFLDVSTAQTLGSVLSILFFFGMAYSESWRAGKHDANLVKFGHYDDAPYLGLNAALISQIPGLLLAIAAILHRVYAILPAFFLAGFKLFYMPFADVIWLLDQVSPFLYLTLTLLMPVVIHLGYTLGGKGYMISERLMYTRKPSQKTRERKFR